ncbi:MAG: ABC transporter ATP-binding protein [Candidatus Omnitrophota bacterium]|jgi:peptide/nickel transport system ATP-binding protein
MVLLKIENLHTSFFTDCGQTKAVNGVSLSLEKGKTLGLVGESGSGKTVTALSIVRLLSPLAKILEGKIIYKGKDLLLLPEEEMRKVRGGEIAFIFQEPMSALNPVFTIGEQIIEAVKLHKKLKTNEATKEVISLLDKVGIHPGKERMKDYPHLLSGGMRQRVLIAMALACSPSLIIADEPTTALDVTIQAEILELIDKLKVENSLTMLLITHDLGIVAEHVDNVAIMRKGEIVEYAPVKDLFSNPKHPYTKMLLDSIPKIK